MSTKTTTDTNQNSSSQLQYDTGSKNLYNQLTQSGGNVLQQYMSSPLNNSMYNLGIGASQKGAAQSGQNNMQALQSMMKTSGLTGNAGQGFQMAQQGRMGRANQGMMAGANTSNVMQALNRQMQATGMGMAFQPLMTGEKGNSSSNTTQQQSGLGTWLPQLLSAGMGMATGGLSGLAGGAKGLFQQGASGTAAAPSNASGIFGTVPGSMPGPPSSGLQPWMFGGQ